MIRIINLRDYKLKEGEVIIKVDRSSVLGNPYYMNGESMRDKVCDDYEKYFNVLIKNNNRALNELRKIYKIAKVNDVALGCWCYPKRCHAEVIKAFLDKFLTSK